MQSRARWVALSAPVVAVGLALLAPPRAGAQQMQMMPPDQMNLIRGLLPTVVNITTFVATPPATHSANAADKRPDYDHPRALLGSGFIIDPSGVILTNAHVVAGAYDVQIMFSDGVRVPGRVLATAPVTDLALIKVDVHHALAAVHWADSDKLQVADPVFAIGNPLGVGISVSAGIISALNRDLSETPYDDFIQTDAAINHGNSGGPLFNERGEVIGVDSALYSPTTGSVGVGFAIPSNDAHFIANLLMHDGSARPAYIGIKLDDVTGDIAAALSMPQPIGSIVAQVHEGSPAASAGLKVGDVVLRYNNGSPPDARALQRDIARSEIGHAVAVTLLRDGREQTVQITPVAWPLSHLPSATTPGATNSATVIPSNLGLSLRVLTPELRARYGLPTQQPGLVVDGVMADTDAYERGMAPGDVILRVQESHVTSPEQVKAAVDEARAHRKDFILALVLSQATRDAGPGWIALRVQNEVERGAQ